MRTDEAAQLNHTLEGFDADLGRFQGRLIEYGSLNLRRDNAVIKVFPCAFLFGRCRAAHHSH